ncbi:MAG: hypothetical protein AAF564_05840 [Bacteroidota bacterium]
MPLLLLFLLCCADPKQPALFPEYDQALELKSRAAAYLWTQQADDGGWHSRTHGLLKGGAAYTPFLLYHLLEVARSPSRTQKVATADALRFMREQINSAGALGFSDPLLLEYPNYATSYGLRVLTAMSDPVDKDRISQMKTYLRAQQFAGSRGITAGHAAYGGWGFGEQRLVYGQVGHVDLSHTRRVLQALRASAGTYDRDAASAFLAQLQNRHWLASADTLFYDGGFHYAPAVFLANKGEVTQADSVAVFHGYATATCDGLLALHALGVNHDAPAVQDALSWLARHDTLAYPAGIPQDTPAAWDKVMFFYHLAVRAEVYATFGWPDGKRTEMHNLLAAHVRVDGSYMNPLGAPNKENDPLLATTLALAALHHLTKPMGSP